MQRKMASRLILMGALLTAPLWALAQTTTNTAKVIGFSDYIYTYEINSTDLSSATVYVGSTPGCSGSGTDACTNSCNSLAAIPTPAATGDAVAYACNDHGIYSNLGFTISFQGVDAASYTVNSKVRIFNNSTEVTVPTQPTISPGVAPQTLSVTVPWSSLISTIGTQSASAFTITVGMDPSGNSASDASGLKDAVKISIVYRYVAVSPLQKNGCDSSFSNYSGFCQYYAFPGDEKIYVYQPAAFNVGSSDAPVQRLDNATAGSIPTVATDPSGMTYAAIRVYYKEAGGFGTFKPSEWQSKDLKVSGDSLTKKYVDGLSNGTSYSIMIANVDKGGNVTYFFDPSSLDSDDPLDNTAKKLGTTQATTPEPVTGLLDNKNCFIATAAYGSGDAADVETLRKFRNSFLLTWEGGRSFVKFYYKNSPPIAHFIAEREWLKFIVREALKPFVFVATVGRNFGLFGLFLLFWGSALFFSASVLWLRRGKTA